MLCYCTKLYLNRRDPGISWDSDEKWLSGPLGREATNMWLGSRAGVGHALFPAPHGLACIQPFAPRPPWVFLRAFPMQQTVADHGSHSSALSFSRTVRVSRFDRICLFSSGWGASAFFYQVHYTAHVLWRNFSVNTMPFSPRALRAFPFVWEEELQSNWCLNLLGFPPSYFFSALGRRESISGPFSLCSLFFLRL